METIIFELPKIVTIDGLPRDVPDMELNLSETTAETLIKCLIFHIRSKTSNSFASKSDASADELADIAARHVADVENNEVTLGAGVGRSTLTPEIEAMRTVIETDARKRFGLKAADAKKEAMTPQAYFRRVASELARLGKPTDADAVEGAFEKKARPLADALRGSKSTTELDI